MKNYDLKANKLNLNEYELTILKMYKDLTSYVDSLSEEQKTGFKIGFLSTLVCINKVVDEEIEAKGMIYSFGSNLGLASCVYNLISDEEIASLLKIISFMDTHNDSFGV